MSQMDRIMGIPQQTKKPSSLRNPREPPAPRYINKQAAIDIARKLQLTSIGKVGLRITDKTSIDSEMISKYGEKREVSRKSIMDRAKGLETARNIKESRVGKCILEANDYESRRFGKQFGKLLEDEDQKKRQMTQKKREFVHQKEKADHSQTVTRADGRKSPLVPPPTTSDGDRRHLPSVHPHGATQQHLRDLASREASQEVSRAASRGKSPGYMRPLSCNRDKSHDSAVGETERFLNSPYMRACLSNLRDEEDNNRILESIKEAQESSKVHSRTSSAKERSTVPAATEVSAPPVNPEVKRPVSQGMSLGNLLNSKRLKQIREASESVSSRQSSPVPPKFDENKVEDKRVKEVASGSSLSNPSDEVHQSKASPRKLSIGAIGDGAGPTDVGSHPETYKAPPSRGKVVIELIKSEFSSKPGTPGIVVENVRTPTSGTPDKMRKSGGTDSKMGFSSLLKRMKEANESRDTPSSDGGGKQQKRSTSSLTVAAQIALLRTRTTSRKKKRAKKLANLPRSRQNAGSGDIISDPRFTQLASSLIPDSSLATDLYRSSGQFSMPDHVATGYRSNVLRVKDGLRQSRNLHNLKRFEALFESW